MVQCSLLPSLILMAMNRPKKHNRKKKKKKKKKKIEGCLASSSQRAQ